MKDVSLSLSSQRQIEELLKSLTINEDVFQQRYVFIDYLSEIYMLDKEQAKEELKKLIELYKDGQRHWDTKSESDIGFHLIEPLFEKVLGWNREDITKEDRVFNKRADYVMKLVNEDVLVVEAKKTTVSLSEEEGRQAVSYAYHKKAKFAVLTNFKNLIAYHALSNIKNVSKNQLKFENSYFRLNFEEFIDKFDILWLLSKESFEKKEINKLLSRKDEKLYKPIDEHILEDLLKIRKWLSTELKLKKPYLENQIDEIVQILIDRLIFIRSVEDRGLEKKSYLKIVEAEVRNQDVKLQLFPYLIEKFKYFNEKYDSKLFEAGLLEKEGSFSDEILRKVILAFYSGTSGLQEDYQFDKIPADLFGNIYEQYLGTILQNTDKRIKLEKESGKRKKMGIYYTPSYIVDYIVKNTVGEYIKDKNIDEILEVKIVDPACGSGSFLIRAFQEVCNVIEEKLKKGEKGKSLSFHNYKERLSLSQKATILQSCIYGIDLDEKAIELAQLNLLLKLLEDENSETKRRILPNMQENIKNGNSLIDDYSIAGDKAFKWEAQFSEVFKNGGFDVVVGNPPYGAELKDDDKTYLKKKFIGEKTGNTASFFIFLGNSILKDKGNLSFIVPKQLTYTSSWTGTRKLLLNENLRYVIDSSEAFQDVELEQIIFIFKKQKREDKEVTVGFSNSGKIIEDKSNIKYFDEQRFPLWITKENHSVFEKILKNSSSLKDIAKVNWGGLVAKYLTKNKTFDSIPCIRGREVQRYHFTNDYFIKKKDIAESYYVKGEKLIFQRIVCRYGEKIIANYRNARIVGTYVNDNNYDDKTVTLIWDSKVNLKFLLGFFNSKLVNWFAHRYLWNRSQLTMEFMYEYARNFPIRIPDKNQEKNIVSLVDQMLSLQKKLHEFKLSGNEKERLEQQINNIDYEIDQEVYKLYGLTKEEIKIVEESLK